ncbi:MAG: hypothetical protein PF588_01160 [Candidatus Kapabacteria bacterium]|jgi:shikimate dehydrogenase|nr:hypothetical protein [Candidatus Kapabacteria bacterium]
MIPEKEYFAVVGSPVLHSKSPQIMNSLLSGQSPEGKEIDYGHYTRFAVYGVEDALFLMNEIGVKGINVTSPYKSDLLSYLNDISKDASAIGAVNTIIKENGRYKGYNTDHIGVAIALRRNGVKIKGSNCLIIGAGDAGRAAAFGLKRAGAGKVIFVNRTFLNASSAAKKMNCESAKIADLENILKSDNPKINLLISALPSNVQVVNKEWLNKDIAILDAVYNNSQLISDAQAMNCKVIPGEEWLLNQAVPAYQYFTKSLPEFPLADEYMMREKLYNYSPGVTVKNSIVLIGFSGTGKTVIGKHLAQNLGFEFIDTDEIIEKQERMSIPDIFKNKGELYFRAAEAKVLKTISDNNMLICSNRGTVVSCGGGIVLNKDNRKILKNLGTVVWLYSSVRTSVKRIRDHSRPLLINLTQNEIRKIFEERRSLYFELSDLVVNSERSVQEVSDKIKAEVLSVRQT